MPAPRRPIHPPVLIEPDHFAAVADSFAEIVANRIAQPAFAPPAGAPIKLAVTTASIGRVFDGYINARYKGVHAWPRGQPLVVDSGNSVLVMPDYAALAALPNFGTDFKVLAANTKEPFGCPAALVRGPIEIETTAGGVYTVHDCIFYACTGPNPQGGQPTQNFGIGCVTPAQTGPDGAKLQSPLSFDPAHPFVELNYAAATSVVALGPTPLVDGTSNLTLYRAAPAGYRMFPIVPNCDWMSLVPRSLKIGPTKTRWPGNQPAIAMVDSGGGPVFFTDPNGYLYTTTWPAQVALPDWAQQSEASQKSKSCQAIDDDLVIELGDQHTSYSFEITAASLGAASDHTAVICEVNQYMEGQYGMNLGGLSVLFNSILIDYAGKRVGLKPKPAPVPVS